MTAPKNSRPAGGTAVVTGTGVGALGEEGPTPTTGCLYCDGPLDRGYRYTCSGCYFTLPSDLFADFERRGWLG